MIPRTEPRCAADCGERGALPSDLAARLGAGVLLAVLVSTLLWWWVEGVSAAEAAALAERSEARARGRLANAESSEPSTDAPRAAVVLPQALPEGRAGAFLLVTDRRALPPEVAPIVTLRRGGSVAVTRAVPAPSRPLAVRAGGRRLGRVGVVLPRDDLDRLSAAERATLLELLRRWTEPGRATPPARIRSMPPRRGGVRIDAGRLDRLLRWQR